MVSNTKYSLWTGILKSLKNGLWVMVLPAAIYAIDGITVWAPEEQKVWMMPLAGFLGYFLKNLYEMKKK